MGSVAREAGVVIPEDDEDAVVEQAVARERRLEFIERLVEEPHRVQIVPKRRVLERAKLQDFVARRKTVVWMVQR